MNLSNAITEVNKYFVYLNDKKSLLDTWKVMFKNNQGELRGDCEDYSLTVFWYLADQNIKTFLWNLFITQKYKLYSVNTSFGVKHTVGSYEGVWFDNWTKRPLNETEFFFITGHKKKFRYFMPIMFLPLLKGLLVK